MRLILSVFPIICFFYAQIALADLRDPTRPVIVAPTAGGPQIQNGDLQAIIISRSGRRMAIYNGRTLFLGSELAGFKVVAIEANAVHLAGPDGKMTLFLFNQAIKKSANQAI